MCDAKGDADGFLITVADEPLAKNRKQERTAANF